MKHKKTFIQKHIIHINWDELIFDALLIIYTEIFLYRIVTGGRGLIDIMGPNALFLGGMVTNFFICWYLGVVRKEYNNHYKNEFALDLCLVAYWLIPLALNVGIAISLMAIAGKMDKLLVTAFTGIIMLTGWGSGYIFGYTEVHGGRGRTVAAFRADALATTVPAGMMFMNVYIVYSFLTAMHLDIIPQGIIIGIPSWALLMYLEYFIFRRLGIWFDAHHTADSAPARFDFLFKKILFPVIVVTVLCLWEEIFLRAMILNGLERHEHIPAGRIIVFLTAGGIIPVRLIMIFQPPLTLINIALGAGTLGYFVCSTVMLMKNIF